MPTHPITLAHSRSLIMSSCTALLLRRSSCLLSSLLLAGFVASDIVAVDVGRGAVRGLQQEQSAYCVAKPEANATALQAALDSACGSGPVMGSVNCDPILQGGSYFQPDTLDDHASYAFTSYYYMQGGASHACDFNGLATLTYTNPSSGTCVYPSNSISTTPSTSSTPSAPSTSLPFTTSPAPSPNAAPPVDIATHICSIAMCTLLFAMSWQL